MTADRLILCETCGTAVMAHSRRTRTLAQHIASLESVDFRLVAADADEHECAREAACRECGHRALVAHAYERQNGRYERVLLFECPECRVTESV